MKKRCTNSACRKEFTLQPGRGLCPHCGVQYRRIHTPAPVRKADSHKPASPKRHGYAVVLTGYQGIRERLTIVKALRTLTGMALRSAVEATKRPTVVARDIPWKEAEAMGLVLEQAGGTIALVLSERAENYGVPLFS